MKQARILGLPYSKNTKTNPENTLEIITQLSILPIEYDDDIEKLVKN